MAARRCTVSDVADMLDNDDDDRWIEVNDEEFDEEEFGCGDYTRDDGRDEIFPSEFLHPNFRVAASRIDLDEPCYMDSLLLLDTELNGGEQTVEGPNNTDFKLSRVEMDFGEEGGNGLTSEVNVGGENGKEILSSDSGSSQENEINQDNGLPIEASISNSSERRSSGRGRGSGHKKSSIRSVAGINSSLPDFSNEWEWSKNPSSLSSKLQYTDKQGPIGNSKNCTDPLEFLSLFLTTEFIDLLVEQTMQCISL